MSTSIEVVEPDLAPAEKVAMLLGKVPAAWRPSIRFLGSTIGPMWDAVQGTLYVRLVSYAKDGFTTDDVKAACLALCSPAVQQRCQWPNDWLKEFAAAVQWAMDSRVAREERRKRAAAVAAVEQMTPEERAEVSANLKRMREMLQFGIFTSRSDDWAYPPAEVTADEPGARGSVFNRGDRVGAVGATGPEG